MPEDFWKHLRRAAREADSGYDGNTKHNYCPTEKMKNAANICQYNLYSPNIVATGTTNKKFKKNKNANGKR